MRSHHRKLLAALILTLAPLGAQPRADAPPAETKSRPSFAVASVRPTNLALGQQIDMRVLPGGTVTATSVTLKFLITVAYGVQDVQISGGPGWMETDRFDIVAKPGENVKLEARPMLQSLLEDRFRLAVRHETKEVSAYDLRVANPGAKPGPNLREMDAGDCEAAPPPQNQSNCGNFTLSPGRLSGHGVTLAAATKPLSNLVGRPVVDKTGITRKFNLTLEWKPDGIAGVGDTRAASDGDGSSIFTAVREQLGLKLDTAKEPTEMLVIERAEKPSEN